MTKFLIAGMLVLLLGLPIQLIAQETAKAAATASVAPKKKETRQNAAKSDSGSPQGMDFNAGVTGPITTEIYADEAFFDSNKNVGIFRGHVKVNDPRFNLQSDKLTAFISKAEARQAGGGAQTGQTGETGQAGQTGPGPQTGQGQGLEKAIAEGNVAVVRDRPDPNGGPPTHAVGRAETATYVAASGDVELKGSPRVQQGLNTHIGTSADTVMVISQNGQLTTHGPSRTEIRQEPKDENAQGDKGDKKTGDKEEKKTGPKEQKKSPQPSPKS